METNILKTTQMLQGNSAQPMNEGDKSVQGNAKNAPFNPHTYPNSENVTPPVGKAAVRVVEPSTRAAVRMSPTELHHKKKEQMDYEMRQAILVEYRKDGSIKPPELDTGTNIDIEV
jgi:hypothetical protein